MASEYPYAMGTGKIPLLLQTVGEKGMPSKATNKWLEQFGMGSSNDRRLIPVLRFIGFIDNSGVPTQRWRDYRGVNSRKVLAEGIKAGYHELFEAHPNAHLTPTDQLAAFFRTNSGLGPEAVSKIVSTFRALVSLADFSDSGNAGQPGTTAPPSANNGAHGESQAPRGQTDEKCAHVLEQPTISIAVNLQLTLPATDDPAVYDALFASLHKHVLSVGNVGNG